MLRLNNILNNTERFMDQVRESYRQVTCIKEQIVRDNPSIAAAENQVAAARLDQQGCNDDGQG